MSSLTHSERYDRLDQILQELAEGQQLLRAEIRAFACENRARRRQARDRKRPIDARIDELLRAIARLKRRKK